MNTILNHLSLIEAHGFKTEILDDNEIVVFATYTYGNEKRGMSFLDSYLSVVGDRIHERVWKENRDCIHPFAEDSYRSIMEFLGY